MSASTRTISKKKSPARKTAICISSAARSVHTDNLDSSVDWLRERFIRGELTPEQIAEVEAKIPDWTWYTPKPARTMGKVLMFPSRVA
jgi:hypothetical protein